MYIIFLEKVFISITQKMGIIVITTKLFISFRVQVEFVGEQGSDTGGITREFFTYVGHAMSTRYLTQSGCFKHNSSAYQVWKV